MNHHCVPSVRRAERERARAHVPCINERVGGFRSEADERSLRGSRLLGQAAQCRGFGLQVDITSVRGQQHVVDRQCAAVMPL